MENWLFRKAQEFIFSEKLKLSSVTLNAPCAPTGTNLNSVMGQKGFNGRQKETLITTVVDVFSDLITTVLFRGYLLSFDYSEPDGVFPTVHFKCIYLICMFVYITEGV